MAYKVDNRKKKFLEVLENAHGIISTACANMKLPRATYYKWYNADDNFKKSVEAIQEVAIDYVESKLFEKIDGVFVDTGKSGDDFEPIIYKSPPSDTAIIFYLKCKGKKRGYVEKNETDVNIKTPINLIFKPPIKSLPLDEQ